MRSYLLFLMGLMFVSLPALAQSSASISELLERKNKTTHECVSTVFTPEEIALLLSLIHI